MIKEKNNGNYISKPSLLHRKKVILVVVSLECARAMDVGCAPPHPPLGKRKSFLEMISRFVECHPSLFPAQKADCMRLGWSSPRTDL